MRQLRDDHNVTLLLNLLNESELRSLGVSFAESARAGAQHCTDASGVSVAFRAFQSCLGCL